MYDYNSEIARFQAHSINTRRASDGKQVSPFYINLFDTNRKLAKHVTDTQNKILNEEHHHGHGDGHVGGGSGAKFRKTHGHFGVSNHSHSTSGMGMSQFGVGSSVDIANRRIQEILQGMQEHEQKELMIA